MSRLTKMFAISISLLFVLTGFLNCTPVHEVFNEGGGGALDFACFAVYEDVFTATYHDLGTSECAFCHGDGGFQLNFAASDSSTAFINLTEDASFLINSPSGRETFYERMTNGHCGTSGCSESQQTLVDDYEPQWAAVDSEFQTCLQDLQNEQEKLRKENAEGFVFE